MTPGYNPIALLIGELWGRIADAWHSRRRRWISAQALDLPASGDVWQQPGTLRTVEVVDVRGGLRGLRISGTLDEAVRAWSYEDYRTQVTGWYLLRRAGVEVAP